MAKKRKRVFALLLALSMCVGLLGTTAFASPGDDPICGKTEHTHTEECYKTLICSQEESTGHSHTDACYELTCQEPESEGHTHTDACYDDGNNLICGQEESEGHTHTDACYTLTCGLTEGEGGHTHTEVCYTVSEAPVCGLEEYTHTEACYAQGDQQDDQQGDQQDEENTLTVTGTDKSGNPVTYTGPMIPAEPTESDASVYETGEAVAAALESAKAALQEAEEAYSQWGDIFNKAMSECKFGAEPLRSVATYYTQASDSQKAWKNWVNALTERQNELLSEGCICGDHQYACEEGAVDETCPVCSQHPELCKGPQPVRSGTYWKFYYDKENQKGTLRIVGDHTEAYPSKGWWPWDSSSYIEQIGGQIYNKVTDVVVEDNVTKLGDYMFANLTNVETISIGKGVTEWGYSMFGGQNIETVTVNSSTFDPRSLAGGGYSGTYHIDTLILDNSDMEIMARENYGGMISTWSIEVDNLVLANVKNVGDYAFLASDGGIQTLEIGNVGEIGACAFCDGYNLTTLTFVEGASVGSIGASAFEGCTSLSGEIVIPDSCTYVGDFAFQDCDKITDLTIPATTKLGYSNIFVNFPPLVERMETILAGQFALNEASSLDSLTVPDGWESSRLGEDNAAGSGDTQVTKAARWTNENKTEAEVEFQFNYDKAQGMDFIFVVDYSGSMAEVGNLEADSDSRFTSMQSKLLDVADELLNTPGYDNRVAFVTFATNNSYLHTLDFTQTYSDAESFVMAYEPYGSTNYSIALGAAHDLITSRTDTSREAAVIFISDGQPNRFFDGTANRPPEYADASTTWDAVVAQINDYADAIKDIQQFGHDTKIFGVLQSIPSTDEERCTQVLQGMCTEGLFFLASDTQEFSDAINNAISAAYNIYTLTDVIGDDFDLVESSIRVSAGQATYDADTRTITWTIYGVPYTTHTMQYDLTLKPVNGSYPYGIFDTNKGYAPIALGTDQVNEVNTPQLSRDNDTPVVIPPDTPNPPSTDPEEPGEEIPEEYVPQGELPEEEQPEEEPGTDIPEEDVPQGELPEEIPDEDVPQGEAPKTGDVSLLYAALAGVSGLGLAGTCLLGGKKRRED